jgi:hypothetical protein
MQHQMPHSVPRSIGPEAAGEATALAPSWTH